MKTLTFIGIHKFSTHYAAEFQDKLRIFRNKQLGSQDNIIRYDLPSLTKAVKNFKKHNPEIAKELSIGLAVLEERIKYGDTLHQKTK